MERVVRLPVRQLVEFVLRRGSIDSRFAGAERANAGARAHRRLQKAGGDAYEPEVFLSCTTEYRGVAYTVEGRADGVFTENGSVCIDEIKTTANLLSEITENFNPLHWAQAECYAYFYAVQHALDEISVRLTYVHLDEDDGFDEGDVKRFVRVFTAENLASNYRELLERYRKWADFTCDWAVTRTDSIRQLPFPFDSYRRGQRTLAVVTYRTIEEGGVSFCQAPTGIGKTISTLFPAVKSIGEGLTERIFYLTAKTLTGQAARDALEQMRSRGLRLKSVTLTAKEKICFQEECVCNPEQCPYANGHYDRVNAAIYELISSCDHFSREDIERTAKEHTVCPFELELDLTLWSDCIVCDYNYLFDPVMYLRRFFAAGRGEYVFLVDEAHNLVGRAREMYSASLTKSEFHAVRKKLPKGRGSLPQALLAVNRLFIELRKAAGDDRALEQKAPLDALNREIVQFVRCCEQWLKKQENSPLREEVLSLYFDALFYSRIAELYDEHYTTAVEVSDGDVAVRQCCLDPSALLREAMERGRATVLFSATLTPLDYFSAVLGGDESSRRVALPSPYERDHLKLLIAHTVSTRYRDRTASTGAVAEMIARVVLAKTGNYIVYFPSYSYMNEVYAAFQERYGGIPTLLQRSGMDEREREAFLAQFENQSEAPLVGFCVLGGIYSEGIDLKGERLIGTVVVGVGLPQIGREQDRIKEYYDQNGRDGFSFAYRYPGMNKVLQAAGRVIRGEHDRGVVLLIDDRFNTPSYLRLFPEHWRGCRLVGTPEALEKELREFWTEGREEIAYV